MSKVYILVDGDGIVQCIASDECNLHKDKLNMAKHHVEFNGIVGDRYHPDMDTWDHISDQWPKEE